MFFQNVIKINMGEFWHYFKYMMAARKHKQLNNEYAWYKYLVQCDINRFLNRFKIRSKNEIPF